MTRDIMNSRACAAPETFIRNFGSLMEARQAAGLDDLLREIRTGQSVVLEDGPKRDR
jgi:hypothetical protein